MMDDVTRQIEEELSFPNMTKFTSKEEVLADARNRLASKRGRTTDRVIQRTASPSSNTENTIRVDQGYGGSDAEHYTGGDTEGGSQTQVVHGGNGRDEIGEGSAYGYSNFSPGSDREYADGRISFNQHSGSASSVGQPEVYAAPGATKKPGIGERVSRIKSKMKTFAGTAFAPIQSKQENDTIKTPVGRSKSQASRVSGKTGWRTLSESEAESLRPKLAEYITWQSEHLDQFIIATTKGHGNIEIWSNLDEAEIEILVDYLLSRGKKDSTTAQAVRFASEILDRIKVAIIVGPRVYKTVNVYLARGLDIPIFMTKSHLSGTINWSPNGES